MKANCLFYLKTLLFICICNNAKAQSADYIVGSHWDWNKELFTSLDLTTKTFTDLDTLNGVLSFGQGESTLDAANYRYFTGTSSGILIVNVLTGAIIDTIDNSPAGMTGMGGIEYDPNTDKLFGSYWDWNQEIFTSLDLSTKIFTDLDTLTGVTFFGQGESTFDAANSRYFRKCNLGILIVNSQTGAIVDTISTPVPMLLIEYYPGTNKLVGCYWNGSNEIFTSLDISTKTLTDLDTLDGVTMISQGACTFDSINGIYFALTNLGITMINAQTGTIIDTIANSIAMKGLEFIRLNETGINIPGDRNKKLTIYPNPSNSVVTINLNTDDYTELDICNLYGQKVKSIDTDTKKKIKLNIENLTGGIYFIRLMQNSIVVETEKLVITKY